MLKERKDYGKLKFIVPDWDDIVDPKFNFEDELHSEQYKHDKYSGGIRIWHIYEDPPLDGVIISRSIIEDSPKKQRLLQNNDIKSLLRIPLKLRNPSRFQIIGDCGAWQYVGLDEPPYDPIDTLEFYQKIGVDYGVSVDHIAFFKDPSRRISLTLNNALKSFDHWRPRYEKGDYSFILLGAVQGVTIDDYIRVMNKLYEKGYRHFALGGLAKRTTNFVEELIDKLIEFVKKHQDIEKIHFLGVARPKLADVLASLTNYCEVSFDNATYLRIAWARSKGNYITLDGSAYTAIRVRPGSKNEKHVLEILHKYDSGEVPYEHVMNVLKEYASTYNDLAYLPYYSKTLKDKPWKKCPCKICRSIGIDVVIFRGNNRNRRRGFHNLWVFYNLLKGGMISKLKMTTVRDQYNINYKISLSDRFKVFEKVNIESLNLKKVLIITHCTAEKNVDWKKVHEVLEKHGLRTPGFDRENEDTYRKVLSSFVKPAEDMYGGTFRYIKKIAEILRKAGIYVDIVIISARYGVISGDSLIIPYEASLKDLVKNYNKNSARPSAELKKWSAERNVAKTLLKYIYRNSYDLIVVNMPRTYATAIKDVIDILIQKPNAILIIPSLSYRKLKNIQATIIPAGSLTKRVHALRLLREFLEMSLRKQKTLDEYLSSSKRGVSK